MHHRKWPPTIDSLPRQRASWSTIPVATISASNGSPPQRSQPVSRPFACVLRSVPARTFDQNARSPHSPPPPPARIKTSIQQLPRPATVPVRESDLSHRSIDRHQAEFHRHQRRIDRSQRRVDLSADAHDRHHRRDDRPHCLKSSVESPKATGRREEFIGNTARVHRTAPHPSSVPSPPSSVPSSREFSRHHRRVQCPRRGVHCLAGANELVTSYRRVPTSPRELSPLAPPIATIAWVVVTSDEITGPAAELTGTIVDPDPSTRSERVAA